MKKYLLILILLLAAFFRLVGLTKAPPGLNWDEVSIGYNAYSILKTGRDEWGALFPLAFKAFGEVKLPGMIYASIPGIALFGPTDLGVRITPAFIGIFGVYVIYLLGKQLFARQEFGLAAAFLLAISPWGVHFSRVSFEAGLAMVLTMLSFYYLLRAQTSPKSYWGAMIFAVLSLYTYNSVRIILPLLLLVYLILGVIKITHQTSRTVIAVMLVGVILAIPSINNLLSKEGQIRWGTVAITDKGFYDRIAESRGYLSSFPDPIPRLIHNKATHLLTEVGNNYIKTFSTEFLFFSGSKNTQRSVQGMGLLYLFELPLLVIGMFKLLTTKNTLHSKILLPWILIAPLASAITLDSPSSVRSLSLLPALLLVESLGLVHFLSLQRKAPNYQKLILASLVLWNIGYFAYQLWFVNPVKYADDWHYGYKQAMLFAAKHYDELDGIYITSRYGEPYIYALFYSQYDPSKYQQEKVEKSLDPTGWVHVESFGKYHFVDFSGLTSPTEIVKRNKGNLLIIGGFATLPSEWQRDLSIRAPNWIEMFEGSFQTGTSD